MALGLLQTTIDTVKHRLITTELRGQEALASPYAIHVILHSLQTLDCEQLLGKSATVTLNQAMDNPRHFQGIISQCHLQKPADAKSHSIYSIEIRPRFYYLTKSQHSRIFNDKSIIDILTYFLKAYSISDYTLTNLTKQYEKHHYLTQYQESDFDFIQRLLAREGIYYYFEFSNNKHVMHFVDDITALPLSDDRLHTVATSRNKLAIQRWQQQYSLTASEQCSSAYDYLRPDQNLCVNDTIQTSDTNQQVLNNQPSASHYPGLYQLRQQGVRQNKQLVMCQRWQANKINFTSNYALISSGLRFKLNKANDNNCYYTINVAHQAHDYSEISQLHDNTSETVQAYVNHVTACNVDIPYAPPLTKPWPIIHDHISAVVAKLDGHMVSPDSLQRIKVCFPGFSTSLHADTMSCWLRCDQHFQWLGSGMQFIPRHNQLVMIKFHHGNPDQPYIAGTETSDINQMPYDVASTEPVYQGYKSQLLNENNDKLGHEWLINDTLAHEQYCFKTPGNLRQSAKNDWNKSTAQNVTQTIGQNQIHQVQQGKSHIQAQHIELQVGASRLTINDAGISIDSPNTHILSSGTDSSKPLARQGDHHKCNKILNLTPHIGGKITTGSPNVFINGRKAARKNDKAHCLPCTDHLHTKTNTIIINGRPAARLNDKTKHGGVINESSSNVHSGPHRGTSFSPAPSPKPQYWLQINYPKPNTIQFPSLQFAASLGIHTDLQFQHGKQSNNENGQHNPYATFALNSLNLGKLTQGELRISNSEIISINQQPTRFPLDRTKIVDNNFTNAKPSDQLPKQVHKNDKIIHVDVLPPPIIINLRKDNPKPHTRLLSDEQLNYFIKNGNNATLFIHGYNIPHGEFKPQVDHVDKHQASFFTRELIATSARIGTGPYGYMLTPDAEYKCVDLRLSQSSQTIYRDIPLLKKAYPELQHRLDRTHQLFDPYSDDQWLNGSGCFNWLIHMEDNLNRATGQFDRSDYRHFTRLLHIHWSGDAYAGINFNDTEDVADQAGIDLVPVITQLHNAGVTINIIAHSLGNRVLLKAMDCLGKSGGDDVLEHVFLCEAAVPQNALSNDPSRDKSHKQNAAFVNAYKSSKKISVLYSNQDQVLGGLFWLSSYLGMSPNKLQHLIAQNFRTNHYSKESAETYQKLKTLLNSHDFLTFLCNNVMESITTDPRTSEYMQASKRLEQKLNKEFNVVPALGYMGLDLFDDPFIRSLVHNKKLSNNNTTKWIYSHSAMKIPNEDIMTHVYKNLILNKDIGIKQLGLLSR